MGLPHPAPEPWVFLSFSRDESSSPFSVFASPGVAPLTSPAPVQMLSFVHGANKVHPVPSTTNLLPANGSLIIPVSARRGVSTAPLFLPGVELEKSVVVGVDENQRETQQAEFLQLQQEKLGLESQLADQTRQIEQLNQIISNLESELQDVPPTETNPVN